MDGSSQKVVRSLADFGKLLRFANRLAQWLSSESGQAGQDVTGFTESRAKALLRSAQVIDDAVLNDFESLPQAETGVRVILYDLLRSTGLAEESEVAALAAGTAASALDEDVRPTAPWLALVCSAFARQLGYPVHQLDPASPPAPHTPAGQVLSRTAHYVRLQVQRSPVERERMGRKLTWSGVPLLEELAPEATSIAPLPPHFRPPIPERYPEVARETLRLEVDETPAPPVRLGQPLVITEDDLEDAAEQSQDVERLPPITLSAEQVAAAEGANPPSPMPPTAVVMPTAATQPRPSFTLALRQMLGQEDLTSTKLRVQVQRYPDGQGLYGLQVRVSCKGIKSAVAGTTNREGNFDCELPVRAKGGLTYDVDVTWPRDEGGEVERKSITLNAERTQFTLPFYRQLNPPGGA